MIIFSLAIGLVFFSLMLVLFFQLKLIWYAEAIIFVAITLLVIDSGVFNLNCKICKEKVWVISPRFYEKHIKKFHPEQYKKFVDSGQFDKWQDFLENEFHYNKNKPL